MTSRPEAGWARRPTNPAKNPRACWHGWRGCRTRAAGTGGAAHCRCCWASRWRRRCPGAKSYTEVAEFAAELSQEQLAALGCSKRAWEARYQAPGETALRRALQRLDVEALDRLVGGWLAAQLVEGDASAVAVDGKTIRGAVGADGRLPHLLAALVHGAGVVVAQRQVGAKTSENEAFAPLLDEVDLPGRVVTADSLQTQRAHARYLVGQRQAAYLLVVKGNQAGMVAAIDRIPERAFSPTVPDR